MDPSLWTRPSKQRFPAPYSPDLIGPKERKRGGASKEDTSNTWTTNEREERILREGRRYGMHVLGHNRAWYMLIERILRVGVSNQRLKAHIKKQASMKKRENTRGPPRSALF
jgi:hypothetical protein